MTGLPWLQGSAVERKLRVLQRDGGTLRLRVYDIERCAKGIQMGALDGNHFSLVVRGCTTSAQSVAHAFSTLQRCGFINYYGPQRFGRTGTRNTNIGTNVGRAPPPSNRTEIHYCAVIQIMLWAK